MTVGGITSTLLRFTLPMMLGQQCYNIADTLIVGRCIGPEALAAVGSAYALMVFLTSVLLGLAMGSGTVFSLQFGAGNFRGLRRSIYVSLVLIGCVTAVLTAAAFLLIDPILRQAYRLPFCIISTLPCSGPWETQLHRCGFSESQSYSI